MIERFGQEPANEVDDGLIFADADARIAPWVLGFAHRRDSNCGHVVFELPELRPTIQLMLADDYYLRERDDPGSWRPVPRIAFWGPRVTWGYGYARRRVLAFGIGLTPRGYDALLGSPITAFVDRVVDLAGLRPGIAGPLAHIVGRGGATEWIRETTELLLRLLSDNHSGPDMLDETLSHLAVDEESAVSRASRAAGMSARQYRRLFQLRYGFSPRLYRRVLRIDRVLRRLHPAPWETDRHPLDPSFADQAHMIREFKALTGVTPGEYVRSKRAHGDATIRSVIAHGVEPPALAHSI